MKGILMRNIVWPSLLRRIVNCVFQLFIVKTWAEGYGWQHYYGENSRSLYVFAEWKRTVVAYSK
jgi:hypothetical protein